MAAGSLTVISGFSGAGKGTIMKTLLERYPQYVFSVSVTTRDPRPGEVHGKDYFFITQEEFDRMVERDELLEHAGYVGHCYGTPRSYVEEQMQAGRDVLLEIDVQGALIIRKKCPDATLLFVTTPSPEILIKRLVGRGTEDAETIRERLRQASTESSYVQQYDAVIVNDDLETAVSTVHETIQAFKRRPERNAAFVEAFCAGLAQQLESMVL